MCIILVTGIENPPVYFGTATAATFRADKSWKPRVYGTYSPNIIQVIKLKSIRWAGHVQCVATIETTTGSS